MDKLKHEELISAYLDGELDAAEAKRTEQWLAEDPRAKKLFEEIKIMQDAIHQLPRYHLEGDLTPGVLDQIVDQPAIPQSQYPESSTFAYDVESPRSLKSDAMRLDAGDEDMDENSKIRAALSPAIETPQADRRRMYLWPGVAIAAAVLLMIFSRSEPLEKDRSITRINALAIPEGPPPQPVAAESLERSLLELKEKATADQIILGARPPGGQYSRSAGNISATTEKVRPETSQPTRTESAAAPLPSRLRAADANHRSTTYTFRVAPSLDLERQLDDLTDNNHQIRLIELGVRKNGKVSHHIFELSGNSESIGKVTEALKDTEGITLESWKNYLREDGIKQPSTKQHSDAEFEKEESSGQAESNSIRMIFIVPSS